MITRNEIEEALDELDINRRTPQDDFYFAEPKLAVNAGLVLEKVEEGGELNDTNCQFVVVKVSRVLDPFEIKHIKFEGYYNSYEGTEWDGLVNIVEAQVVQKTVWNKLEE